MYRRLWLRLSFKVFSGVHKVDGVGAMRTGTSRNRPTKCEAEHRIRQVQLFCVSLLKFRVQTSIPFSNHLKCLSQHPHTCIFTFTITVTTGIHPDFAWIEAKIKLQVTKIKLTITDKYCSLSLTSTILTSCFYEASFNSCLSGLLRLSLESCHFSCDSVIIKRGML